MQPHYFKDRFKKEVMSKNSFLTYKQGLSLVVPGSRQETAPRRLDSWNQVAVRLRYWLDTIGLSLEMMFREVVLSNFVMTLYVLHGLASRAFTQVVAHRDISIGRILKRVIDVVGSALGLALLSPVFLLVAIAIKLDSDGPVFFTQHRIGHNRRRSSMRSKAPFQVLRERRSRDRRRLDLYGKPFRVYKFRSMVHNAEKKSGPIWATKNDPRITRVGAFLRKSRLDEFPQLLNVLKGEMSLVGPRPERRVFIESLSKDIEDYRKRLDVKPGITGLAQVITGYDTSLASVKCKVKQDLHYINNWSLLQDVRILMKTVIVVITGKGAF